jgi:NADH-quinone oxidoreductase subunit M
MGPVNNVHYLAFADARWNEKFAAAILIAGIVIVGVAPFWLTDLITPATGTIMKKMLGF